MKLSTVKSVLLMPVMQNRTGGRPGLAQGGCDTTAESCHGVKFKLMTVSESIELRLRKDTAATFKMVRVASDRLRG